jgi:hypothetical protein
VKIVAWLAATAALIAAALYMVVSLNRWEWNRALFFGLIVVIAEIGLATGLVLRKLARHQVRSPHDPEVHRVLRDSRPPRADRFAWMKETTRGQLNVFITFLVGGGVILSAGAWVLDRIASKTSTQIGEKRLASELRTIAYPKGGLLVDDVTVLAQEVPGADDEQIRRLLRRAGHA